VRRKKLQCVLVASNRRTVQRHGLFAIKRQEHQFAHQLPGPGPCQKRCIKCHGLWDRLTLQPAESLTNHEYTAGGVICVMAKPTSLFAEGTNTGVDECPVAILQAFHESQGSKKGTVTMPFQMSHLGMLGFLG